MFDDIYPSHNPRALDDALMLVGGEELRDTVLAAYRSLHNAELRGGLAVAEAAENNSREAYLDGYSDGYATSEMAYEGAVVDAVFSLDDEHAAYPVDAPQPTSDPIGFSKGAAPYDYFGFEK